MGAAVPSSELDRLTEFAKRLVGKRAATLAVVALMATPLRADLAGTYRLDRAASDNVNAAIEAVVKKMNVLTRGIARNRLRKTNPPYGTITLAFTDREARISTGGSTVTLPASGAPVKWNREGESLTVRGRRQDNTFVETFDAKDGRRTNTFSLDGDRLILNVTVTSPRLPSALRYRLVYRR